MKKRILVIDDDVLVLKSVENLLAREGYEIERAKDGEEAEAKFRAADFDLVISDIRMPRQDGISVVTHLKQICSSEKKKEVPFIFITGYASEEAPIDAIKLGAKDYLLKPFDLDELVASVKRHIL